MIHKLHTHPQTPSVVVAATNDLNLVAVGTGWFESAFEVAFGGTTEETLRRFSDELRNILDSHQHVEDIAYQTSAEDCLALVRSLQHRMCVAAEWAERIDEMNREAQP